MERTERTVGHVLGLVEKKRAGEDGHESAHLCDDLRRALPVPVLPKEEGA